MIIFTAEYIKNNHVTGIYNNKMMGGKNRVKKFYYTVFVLVLVCFILPVACAAPATSPSSSAPSATPKVEPIVAKLTDAYPSGMSAELALQKFASLAKEKTNGRLIVEVHSNGELYSREDEMMAVSTGAVQLMCTNGPSMVTLSKATIILNLPYFWPDYKTLREFEATPEWQAIWQNDIEKKLGIKTIAYVPVGPGMSANKVRPIKKVADFKGLKYRSASTVDAALYKTLGVEAIQIPITELWTALEQGMVDGFSTTFAKFYTGPEADYGKYAGTDQVTQVEGWLFVNAAWWDQLPADIKQILEKEVLPEVESYATSEADRVVAECIAESTKRGVTWTPIEDMAALKAQISPFFQAMKKQVGNDAIWDKAEQVAGIK